MTVDNEREAGIERVRERGRGGGGGGGGYYRPAFTGGVKFSHREA